MLFVDINALNLPDDLRGDLENASAQLMILSDGDRDEFINRERNVELWRRTKPYLTQLTGNHERDSKCWYCEVKDVRFDYHVDHFRPKNRVKNKGSKAESGYWWLAFVCTNYRLSCGYCNSPHRGDDKEARGKWDQFPLGNGSRRATTPLDNLDEEIPLLADPINPGDRGLLYFGDDGRVYSANDQGFSNIKAEATIDILNLNDIRIVEARKQLRQQCLELVKGGNIEYSRFDRDGSPVAKRALDDICHKIRELVLPTSEFSSTAHDCFQGTGEKWVLKLI